MIRDKKLRKKLRGTFVQKTNNNKNITVVKWPDNKCVTLSSTYCCVQHVDEVKRYSKVDKKKVVVSCPKVVKEYNHCMGVVDLFDMLVSLYRTGMKTRRWYFGIFSQIIDVCVNNAWLLYRREMNMKKKNPKL